MPIGHSRILDGNIKNMTRVEQPDLSPRQVEPIQRVAKTFRMSMLEALYAMQDLPPSTLRVLVGVDKSKVQDSSIRPNDPAVVSPKP